MTFLFGYLAIWMFLRVQNALFVIIRILIHIVHAVMNHVAIVFDTQLKFLSVDRRVKNSAVKIYELREKQQFLWERKFRSIVSNFHAFFHFTIAYRKSCYARSYWHVNQLNEIAHIKLTLDSRLSWLLFQFNGCHMKLHIGKYKRNTTHNY